MKRDLLKIKPIELLVYLLVEVVEEAISKEEVIKIIEEDTITTIVTSNISIKDQLI